MTANKMHGEQLELEEAIELAQWERKRDALDAMGLKRYLDIPLSVSAMAEAEDLYDFVTADMSREDCRRYHRRHPHGS